MNPFDTTRGEQERDMQSLAGAVERAERADKAIEEQQARINTLEAELERLTDVVSPEDAEIIRTVLGKEEK